MMLKTNIESAIFRVELKFLTGMKFLKGYNLKLGSIPISRHQNEFPEKSLSYEPYITYGPILRK